jgi:uncharacterized membrane protein
MNARLLSFAEVLAFIGLGILLTGGFVLRLAPTIEHALIECNSFGIFFLPLLLLALRNDEGWRNLTITKVMRTFWDGLNAPQLTVPLFIIFSILLSAMMIARYESYAAGWDLAIYANACSNGLYSGLRNHTSLMADHFEPILALFVPFCSNFNPVYCLLIAMGFAWSGGAYFVNRICLHFGASQSLAHVMFLVFIFFSGHNTVATTDFHPYALSLFTVPFIWLLYLQRRFFWMFCAVIVHLSLKENTSLFIAGLGILLSLKRESRWQGIFLAILGVIGFLLIMKIIYPHFRNGQESEYFAKYYGHLGRTMPEFFQTFLTHPQNFLMTLVDVQKLRYLFLVTAPFVFFPVLCPRYLIPVLGALGIGLLSNVYFMYSANFHYEAEIYPWFFVATLTILFERQYETFFAGVGSILCRHWPALVRYFYPGKSQCFLIFFSVMTCFFMESNPIGRIGYYMPSKAQIDLSKSLNTLVLRYRNERVAVVDRLAPHMAAIKDLTLIDEQDSANVIVVAYPAGNRLWNTPMEQIEGPLKSDWDKRFQREQPFAWDQSYRVWHK